MKENFCVYLDAGHGGFDKTGKYVTAPSKQFEHSKGEFHKGRWFYEGVWNRTMVNLVAQKLNNLGITNLIVSHDYLDTPLQRRVDIANWYHANFKNGIFISTHANAGGGAARGYEVYTTPGTTASDKVAQIHFNHVKELLSDRISLRSDTSDSDHDKEAQFFVLRKTNMPAILVEHLFFDNYQDATLLMDDEIIDLFAEAQVRTVIEYYK